MRRFGRRYRSRIQWDRRWLEWGEVDSGRGFQGGVGRRRGKRGVGTATTNVDTTATSLNVSVTSTGLINLAETDGVTLTAIDTANGPITITTGGDTVATNVTSTTSNAANDISITASTGDITVGTVDAKALGAVTIEATAGSILDDEAGTASATVITGDVVTLTAKSGV